MVVSLIKITFMKSFSFNVWFAAVVVTAALAACSSNPAGQNANADANREQTANTNDSNSVSDDLEELKQRVSMPFEPEEAVWREQTAGDAGGKRKLTAVLRFAAEDANKIEQQAATYQPAAPIVSETESWFPAELIAQSQISGDETIKGKSYAPKDFLQPPLSAGKLIRIENSDYFILELNSGE